MSDLPCPIYGTCLDDLEVYCGDTNRCIAELVKDHEAKKRIINPSDEPEGHHRSGGVNWTRGNSGLRESQTCERPKVKPQETRRL